MVGWIEGKPESISKYAFGTEKENIGEVVILIKGSDSTEQYKCAFDSVFAELKGGVFSGVTGAIDETMVSAIYSKGPADIGDCVAFLGLSKANCKTIFYSGSAGGLNEGFDIGDFFIVDEAAGNDGFSSFLGKLQTGYFDSLFSNKIKSQGSAAVIVGSQAKRICSSFNVACHRGKLFTIPGVCFESKQLLEKIKQQGFDAIDMGTAQFYSACNLFGFGSLSIRWIADLPLARSFIYQFEGNKKVAQRDFNRRQQTKLNLAKINVELIRGYIQSVKNQDK